MKTMSERIEAAARQAFEAGFSSWERLDQDIKEAWCNEYRTYARMLFPELFDGTGWVAPWEASDPMFGVAPQSIYYTVDDLWKMFRDAHLSPTHTKEGRET